MKKNIFPESSTCLAKKHFSDKLSSRLSSLKTSNGFSLSGALRSGVENSDSHIGFYAGDAESYTLFTELLHPIIEEYHGIKLGSKQSPERLPLEMQGFEDTSNILSLRIRVARNITPFSFTPHMTREERKNLEQVFIEKIKDLPDELKGEYFAFSEIDVSQKKRLIKEKLFFPKGDRFQEAAGINRDYPTGRGIFFTEDRRLRIWLNEEDHLRIICQQQSGDIIGLYSYFCRVMECLESLFEFSWHDQYGYLSSCPTNIGTSMRAGAHMKLLKLNERREELQQLADDYDLQIRGTSGEKTDVEDAIFDLSNSQRLGITEEEIISKLHKGLTAVNQAENG